ncbi:hypothetical protein BC939DRAFT_143760 [Gamsiella multidivaricata]|uniref:uncharacterized protein n=1 Tax=Gamsiella multidivaricata TaxID=101098 RepID=UPI0022211155|nr:uncharacterized protein BC939DRAFT_143760 [Gamsiella multidivaricata]KAI7824406.1 hypothetical protein BC939DRAFT_143760 [Gamsiella multidivaricata]
MGMARKSFVPLEDLSGSPSSPVAACCCVHTYKEPCQCFVILHTSLFLSLSSPPPLRLAFIALCSPLTSWPQHLPIAPLGSAGCCSPTWTAALTRLTSHPALSPARSDI